MKLIAGMIFIKPHIFQENFRTRFQMDKHAEEFLFSVLDFLPQLWQSPSHLTYERQNQGLRCKATFAQSGLKNHPWGLWVAKDSMGQAHISSSTISTWSLPITAFQEWLMLPRQQHRNMFSVSLVEGCLEELQNLLVVAGHRYLIFII